MNNQPLTFIDLFAGIGGFRIALENLGAKCIFSSEINPHAIKMYQENFGDNAYCDITTLDPQQLADFDILCAGFPCQAFSISGKQLGFADKTRGTLFFDICRILKVKQPAAFILENVQNLEKHDKGNTLTIMLKTLKELGYTVSYKVLNAKDFGVPQNRARIILVGSNQNKIFDFNQLSTQPTPKIIDCLEPEADLVEYLEESEYTLLPTIAIKQQKSGLIFVGYRNKNTRQRGVRPGSEMLSRMHKQPNRIYDAQGIHPTLTSQEKSGRYFILVNGKVRKLTLNECYKFMGFPADFKKVGSKSNLYERMGNSVVVPMIQSIAQQMIKQFWEENN